MPQPATDATAAASALTAQVPPPAPPAADPVSIAIPQGLPGFAGITRFRLEPLPGVERFLRLRAEDAEAPAFIVLPQDAAAGALVEPAEASAAAAALGLGDGGEVALLFVVTSAREEGRLRLFVNRRAPILVDTHRRVAFQVVLPRPDYPVREPLLAA